MKHILAFFARLAPYFLGFVYADIVQRHCPQSLLFLAVFTPLCLWYLGGYIWGMIEMQRMRDKIEEKYLAQFGLDDH